MTLREALQQDASLYCGHDFFFFDGKVRRRGQIEGIHVIKEQVQFILKNVSIVLASGERGKLSLISEVLTVPGSAPFNKIGDMVWVLCEKVHIRIAEPDATSLVSQR